MNQIVVIFVPYGETFAGVEANQRLGSRPKDEIAEIRSRASSQLASDAEQLPLWRWFTFEKGHATGELFN